MMKNLDQKERKSLLKIKGSALLSSILVLITTLLFIKIYQEVYCASMENNLMIIKYLSGK
ncbi:hypothetical protein E0701_03580 [Lactobacillus helveticus]|nr:hypothetical protein [Lactobacillus helveticus]